MFRRDASRQVALTFQQLNCTSLAVVVLALQSVPVFPLVKQGIDTERSVHSPDNTAICSKVA